MNRALLEKPFEPAQIRQRKGRNGVLDYIEGHNARRGAAPSSRSATTSKPLPRTR